MTQPASDLWSAVQGGRFSEALNSLRGLEQTHSHDIQLQHNVAVVKFLAGGKRDLAGLARSLVHISRCCAALSLREEAIMREASHGGPMSVAAMERAVAVDIADTVAAPEWGASLRGDPTARQVDARVPSGALAAEVADFPEVAFMAEYDPSVAWSNLAAVLASLGRWDEAAQVCQSVLTMSHLMPGPAACVLCATAAACAVRRGDVRGCLRSLDLLGRAVERLPGQPEAWQCRAGVLRGEALLMCHRLHDAVQHSEGLLSGADRTDPALWLLVDFARHAQAEAREPSHRHPALGPRLPTPALDPSAKPQGLVRQALQLSRLGKHRAAAVLAARATEAPDAEWGGDPASLPSTARWAELQYLTALQLLHTRDCVGALHCLASAVGACPGLLEGRAEFWVRVAEATLDGVPGPAWLDHGEADNGAGGGVGAETGGAKVADGAGNGAVQHTGPGQGRPPDRASGTAALDAAATALLAAVGFHDDVSDVWSWAGLPGPARGADGGGGAAEAPKAKGRKSRVTKKEADSRAQAPAPAPADGGGAGGEMALPAAQLALVASRLAVALARDEVERAAAGAKEAADRAEAEQSAGVDAAVEALVGEAYAQEVFVATALLRSCLVTGAYVALGTGRPRDAVAMCREAMGLSDGYPQEYASVLTRALALAGPVPSPLSAACPPRLRMDEEQESCLRLHLAEGLCRVGAVDDALATLVEAQSAVEATPGPGTIERQALVLSSILTALAAAGSLDEATEVDSQLAGLLSREDVTEGIRRVTVGAAGDGAERDNTVSLATVQHAVLARSYLAMRKGNYGDAWSMISAAGVA